MWRRFSSQAQASEDTRRGEPDAAQQPAGRAVPATVIRGLLVLAKRVFSDALHLVRYVSGTRRLPGRW